MLRGASATRVPFFLMTTVVAEPEPVMLTWIRASAHCTIAVAVGSGGGHWEVSASWPTTNDCWVSGLAARVSVPSWLTQVPLG